MTVVPPANEPSGAGQYQPFVPPQPPPLTAAPQAPSYGPPNPGFPTGGYGSPHRPNEQLKANNRSSLTFGMVLIGLSIAGAIIAGLVLLGLVGFVVFANVVR